MSIVIICGALIFLGLIYFAVAKETGFSLIKGTAGGSRFASIGGLLSSTKNFKAALVDNTPGENLESKRWWWYITLVVCSIILVYVTPEKYSDYRFAIGGWFILLCLHLIVWPFFTEKTSLTTKVVMTAFMLFFINAAVLPNATRVEVSRFQDALKTFDENHGKVAAIKPEHSSAGSRKAYQSKTQKETRTIVFYATEDKFTEVRIPSGVQFSIDCPDDGLAKVFHRDAQQGIVYDCAQTIEVGENLHNFRIGFSAKTETPVKVVVRITS